MDLKIARNGFLAPNPASHAIFIFFAFFDNYLTQKYCKGAKKVKMKNFFGKNVSKVVFFEKSIPKPKIFKISKTKNLGF